MARSPVRQTRRFRSQSDVFPAVKLTNVTLSTTQYTYSAANNTVIANITGVLPGAQVSVLPNDGRFKITGNQQTGFKLVKGAAATSPGNVPIYIRQTYTARNGSHLDTPFSLMAVKPLSSLPLSVGAKVAMLGDSLTANATQGLNGFLSVKVRTAFDWLSYTLGRLRNFNANTWTDATDTLNGAVGSNWGRGQQGLGPNGGGVRPGINSYIPAMLTHTPGAIIYAPGTNNIIGRDDAQPGPTTDSSYAAANLNYIKTKMSDGLRAFRIEGIPAIVGTIPISGTYAQGSASDLLRRKVNTWIMSLHNPSNGVWAWDRAAAYEKVDGSLDADCFQADTIHNSTYGAWKCSLSLDTALAAVVTAGDAFSTVRAGTSLLLATPGMLGTAGSNGSTTTVSGQIATNYSLQTSNTASADRIVASKEVISVGVSEKQVMTITPNGVANTLTLLSQIIPPALVAGDWYQAFVEVEDDGLGRWSQIQLQVNVTTGSSSVRCTSGAGQNYSSDQARLKGPAFGTPSSRMLLVGNPTQVPTGVSIDRLRASLIVTWPAAAQPFTVKVSGLGVFKITDPRPAWLY